jgi:hypothetical protein
VKERAFFDMPFKSENHTLEHTLTGCGCRMNEIFNCVICGKELEGDRDNVDTCGKVCFKRLLRKQRERG